MSAGLDKSLDDLIGAKRTGRGAGRGAGRGGRGAGGRGRPLVGINVRKTVATKPGGVAQRGAVQNRGVRDAAQREFALVAGWRCLAGWRWRWLAGALGRGNTYSGVLPPRSCSVRSRMPLKTCGTTTCTRRMSLHPSPSSAVAGAELAQSCL